MAAAHNVPVYVTAESYKFARLFPLNQVRHEQQRGLACFEPPWLVLLLPQRWAAAPTCMAKMAATSCGHSASSKCAEAAAVADDHKVLPGSHAVPTASIAALADPVCYVNLPPHPHALHSSSETCRSSASS